MISNLMGASGNARPQGCGGEQNEQRFVARERIFIVGVALAALHR